MCQKVARRIMASVVGARALLQRASTSGPGACQARARAQVHTSTQARWRERRPGGGGHDDGSAHAISAPPSLFSPLFPLLLTISLRPAEPINILSCCRGKSKEGGSHISRPFSIDSCKNICEIRATSGCFSRTRTCNVLITSSR